MKNLYNIILTDAIVRYKKHNPSDWKFIILFAMSMFNAFNWVVVVTWMEYFGIFDYPSLKIDYFPKIFPLSILNIVPEFSILYIFPFVIINYFLILFNGRHLKLVKKYQNTQGHYVLIYGICTGMLFIISAVILGIVK